MPFGGPSGTRTQDRPVTSYLIPVLANFIKCYLLRFFVKLSLALYHKLPSYFIRKHPVMHLNMHLICCSGAIVFSNLKLQHAPIFANLLRHLPRSGNLLATKIVVHPIDVCNRTSIGCSEGTPSFFKVSLSIVANCV